MKTINLFIFFLLVCLVGCNDNDSSGNRISAESKILVKGEGDSVVLSMNGTDWNIEGLYASIGERMVGKDNKPLALEGIGNLVFSWYRIVRDDYGSLKIIVFENFRDSERGFVMRLYREGYTEDVTLRQKATVGYKFEDIVFSVMDGDGISYVTSSKGFSGATLHNDFITDCYVTYYPYLNAKVSTVFESDDMRAFAWNVNGDGSLKEQIVVKVPTDILNGNVILGNAEREYSDKRLMTESDLVNVSDSFTVKARTKSTLTGEIVYRKLCVSYTISLINNETNQVRKISGKYIELTPVDYNTKLECKDLP